VLEAPFWTDSRRADFTATQAVVRSAIVAALRAAGIGLPDPDVRVLKPRHPEQWRRALAGLRTATADRHAAADDGAARRGANDPHAGPAGSRIATSGATEARADT